MDKAIVQHTERATLDLWPQTGKILGLSRSATYDAARRGDIPVIRIGKRYLVPRAALYKLLDSPGAVTGDAA